MTERPWPQKDGQKMAVTGANSPDKYENKMKCAVCLFFIG